LAAAVDEKRTRSWSSKIPLAARGLRPAHPATRPELIAYHDYTVQPPYRFTGCERGHLKTTANAHRAGAPAACWTWTTGSVHPFRPGRGHPGRSRPALAEIVNGTGPYDLVYFDGAETCMIRSGITWPTPQHRVYRLFDPPPPACEAAMSGPLQLALHDPRQTPTTWTATTSRTSAARFPAVPRRFAPKISPGSTSAGIFRFHPDMGPDVSNTAEPRGGLDCPVSLRLTLAEVAAHPRADDCFDVIKTWEDARLAGKLTEAQRAMLKTQTDRRYVKVWDAVFKPMDQRLEQSHLQRPGAPLFTNERGEYELVPAREVSEMAGGLVKALRLPASGASKRYLCPPLGQARRDEPDAARVVRAPDGHALVRQVGDIWRKAGTAPWCPSAAGATSG